MDKASTTTRRTLLKGTAMTGLASALPAGAALAQAAPAAKGPKLLEMEGKAKLVVLGDRPLVAETPASLLDDDVTPTDKLFVRNNGQFPEMPADAKAWKIKIDGEVNTPIEIALGDLMAKFENVTYQLMLECGGNGRSYFTPEARGNQWTNGGAGCPQWTGVRLADVLKAAGLKPSAVYTGHYGAEPTLAGETDKPTISRGMRLDKAMEPHTLIAFKLNGKDLPLAHGAPVRLVVPGWAGSLSTKWLPRIWVRDQEAGQGQSAGQQVRLAALHRHRRPAERRLLRGVVARHRRGGPDPALRRFQLEPAGIRRQPGQSRPRARRVLKLTIAHVCVI